MPKKSETFLEEIKKIPKFENEAYSAVIEHTSGCAKFIRFLKEKSYVKFVENLENVSKKSDENL